MAKVKEQIDIPFQEGTITVLYYSDDVDGYGFDLIHDGMEFVFGHGEEAERFAYQAFRTVCDLIKQRPAELLDALEKITAITPDVLAQLQLIKDHQPLIETYHNNAVVKLCRFDTMKQAESWLAKNEGKFEETLRIGTNIKDGFVVYHDKEEKHMITLQAWDFALIVPFEVLEEITVDVFNQSVSEFVEEYTHDQALLVYQLLQDDEIHVDVELNAIENMKLDEVYEFQEYQVTLHYDHLDLVCEASYENQAILTKQELREYAISQFLQYEDFGNINFWELDVTVKLTKITLTKVTEFSL